MWEKVYLKHVARSLVSNKLEQDLFKRQICTKQFKTGWMGRYWRLGLCLTISNRLSQPLSSIVTCYSTYWLNFLSNLLSVSRDIWSMLLHIQGYHVTNFGFFRLVWKTICQKRNMIFCLEQSIGNRSLCR